MTPLEFVAKSELRLWAFMSGAFFADEAPWLALVLTVVGVWLVCRYALLTYTAHRQCHGADPQAPVWAQEVMAPMRSFYATHLVLASLFLGVVVYLARFSS